MECSLGKEEFGRHLPWFSFQLHFPKEEEGFLWLFSQNQKCHGIGEWEVLSCKVNLTEQKVTFECRGVHLSLPFSDTYHPKYVISCHSEVSCLHLSAYAPPPLPLHPLPMPTCIKVLVSCHLAPAPISLLTPSYLTACCNIGMMVSGPQCSENL